MLRFAEALHREGRNVREVSLTEEAAWAVFEIGAKATDPDIRAWSWSDLGRHELYDPGFTSVLLNDLENYPDDEVRTMAVHALAPYVDDDTHGFGVAGSDASFEVRYAARKALGMIPD